jgi:hypothetical protein
MRRGQLIWGVVLLLLGGFMLAGQMGIKLPNGKPLMDIFFPALLILAGLWVLLSVFMRGSVESESASIDLQGATSARLKLNHGAGELKIHSGASANEFAHGTFVGGLDHKASRDGDRLEVRMKPAREFLDFPSFGQNSQLDWDVALNPDIPLDLSMNLGANKSTIDLSGMNITNLDVDTGASDTNIILPSKGRFRADLDFGAASMVITIPDGMSARIRSTVVAGDMHVDTSRFPRNSGYYQSPDFETAVNAVDLTIDGGAASVKIK